MKLEIGASERAWTFHTPAAPYRPRSLINAVALAKMMFLIIRFRWWRARPGTRKRRAYPIWDLDESTSELERLIDLALSDHEVLDDRRPKVPRIISPRDDYERLKALLGGIFFSGLRGQLVRRPYCLAGQRSVK